MKSVTPRGDDARARLLRTALEAFAVKGFHGTTTRDIAAAAGLSPAALYVHFPSKEEMLYLLSRTGHQESLAVLQAAVTRSTDPVIQLRMVVREHAIWHARSHTLGRIVNYEMAALAPRHYSEIAAIRQQIEGLVRSIIDSGVAAGHFTVAEPHMAALALLSLGIDVARWYREEGTWSPEQIGDQYAALAYRMVAGGSREA